MALSDEEADIGKRIHLVRKQHGVSRRLASTQMGLSPDRLKRIERGEVSLRFFHGILFCQFTDANPMWLAFGEPEQQFGFPGAEFPMAVEDIDTVGFLDVMKKNRKPVGEEDRRFRVRDAGSKPADNKVSGGLSLKHYLIPKIRSSAPGNWDELRAIFVSKTQSAEAKQEVAKDLGVTLAAISQWRSGASAPTADKTLRILRWVEESEAKQRESAGKVSEARPARKTRGKAGYEKPTDRKKK